LPILQDENALSESSYLGWFNACSPSEELRNASTEVDKLFREAKVRRFTGQDIFQLVQAISDRGEPLDEEDQLSLAKLREQFRNNGLGFGDEVSETRMTQISGRIKEISQAYVRNLDSNTAGLWLSMDELDGLPQSYLKRWKADGDKRWVDFKTPNLLAIFRNAKNPEVRRRYWTEWENRFRDDNGPLQKEMVCLRDEAARLMGYAHHASRREADRMLNTETVQKFLSQLQEVLKTLAEERLKALSKIKAGLFAEVEGAGPPGIFKWDEWYFSQLYDKQKFQVDQEKIAEYFPLKRALPSIMKLLEKLFGMQFVEIDTEIWHPDVRAFGVWNEDKEEGPGEFLGFLYLDLFPRDFKYGHKGHYCLQPVCSFMASLTSFLLVFYMLISNLCRVSSEQMGLDSTQVPLS
jgi:metallopeptidase MepB